MTTIGFEADWTIHRDGCKDAIDLDIIGTFGTLDELVNHLIETNHGYADDFQTDPAGLRADLKGYCVKPCTGLR